MAPVSTMPVIEAFRELAGDGALAGPGRAIDGDNQTMIGHNVEYIRRVHLTAVRVAMAF